MLDREGEIVEHLAGVEDLPMQPTRRRLGAGRKWQSSSGKAPGSFATAASRDW
jgi:hypothetical protein